MACGQHRVATTVLGEEPITLTAAPGSAELQVRSRSGRTRRHNAAQSTGTNSVALTGATTKVTADSTVPVTLAPPTPRAGTSATASRSASTSATSTGTASAAPASQAASTDPPPIPEIKPIPEINSLAITQLSCPSNDLLQASVAVTSDSQGGELTLTWFYDSVTGAQPLDTTTYDLAAGQTSQTVSPPGEDSASTRTSPPGA
jgi:hypothetical protein